LKFNQALRFVMARKNQKSDNHKSESQQSGADAQSDSENSRIAAAAMEEAAAVGWHAMTMTAVAARAGVKLGELLLRAPTKQHLLWLLADETDQAVFGNLEAIDDTVSVKDRLFDLMMRRFDALQKYRDGVLALSKWLLRDPLATVLMGPRLSRSMASTLTAAGVKTSGLWGCAQTEALKVVYASALNAWRHDDSTDMSKTMAALDKALGHAERAASFVKGRNRRAAPNPDPVPPEAAAESTGN
jgi:AcrR family transcriptional regulator